MSAFDEFMWVKTRPLKSIYNLQNARFNVLILKIDGAAQVLRHAKARKKLTAQFTLSRSGQQYVDNSKFWHGCVCTTHSIIYGVDNL